MKYEKAKFLGEEFQRETLESLAERNATDLEFAMNGFIFLSEQPERLSEMGSKE